MGVNTPCMTYSESGQTTGGGPCAEFVVLKSDRDYLYDGLNKILHPNGDGPERPSGCDLLSFLKSDLRKLAAERDALLKALEAADALAAHMLKECECCSTPCESYALARLYKEARDGNV